MWGDPVMEGLPGVVFLEVFQDFQSARSGLLPLAAWPHAAGLVGGDPSLGLQQRAETPSSTPVGSPDLAWRHFLPRFLEGTSRGPLAASASHRTTSPGIMLTVRPLQDLQLLVW